ncbi:4'-phosphopantetheinyl transferase [Anaeromyces robustus]|uniref:holo-[acyl-carrier-protein] synthase n=1 Tax=Anaeromyces robustus TaxID=1754192 RepID=A0A1Y1WJE3_9FUNG|nr:4'-phosphopantetheinyl transferase [Anaeromyces robustus]|eukprot:ORX73475.1 4'-phosphopantetheinyl transferase [Anaeromyces robustus]
MECEVGTFLKWKFNAEKWNPSPEEFNCYLQYVQPEERIRIKKFFHFIDSKRALAGRLLLRQAIHTLLNVNWSSIELGRSSDNKPIIKKIKNSDIPFKHISVNISHHGEWVALIAHTKKIVGIDVMNTTEDPRTDIDSFFDLMADVFTKNEWKEINELKEDNQRLERFYKFWSLKESYVKAIGKGLVLDLQSIEFTLNRDDIGKTVETATLYRDGKRMDDWKFYIYHLDDIHCSSIAINSVEDDNIKNIDFENLSIEKLVENAENV